MASGLPTLPDCWQSTQKNNLNAHKTNKRVKRHLKHIHSLAWTMIHSLVCSVLLFVHYRFASV
jgi:hypothetical protein